MTKKIYNYDFQAHHSYSRKEIEELTSLSRGTVEKTLKLAGLIPQGHRYLGSDLLEKFVPIRRLFEAGMTEAEIREALNMKEGGQPHEEEVGESQPSGGPEADFSAIDKAIAQGAAETMIGLTEAVVSDFRQFLPGVLAIAFAKDAESGAINASYKQALMKHFGNRHNSSFPGYPSARHFLRSAEPHADSDENTESDAELSDESFAEGEGSEMFFDEGE